ncbi:hypothetical protein ACFO9E_33105 [Streptomyces maoxianensis]|uniref:Uncharacterized protein n=1 Tax=Streptomyces maoxianensis TaxID=1459942 RepID=A0ABV9GE29_9ACTN
MSDTQNQGSGQTPPAPAPPPPAQPSITDSYTNPALVGSEKKSDTKSTLTKAVRPQGNQERR